MISFEAYKDLKGINASFLKACLKSEWHGYMYLHAPKEPTPAMELGSAIHCALLEPERFMTDYVVQPVFTGLTKDGKESAQSGEAKAKKQAWLKENENKIAISEDDLAKVNLIVNNCLQVGFIKDALNTFEKEKTLAWINEEGSFKARLDMISPDKKVIVDIKSGADCDANAFTRQCINLGYDIQMLHYSNGVADSSTPTMYALAVETTTGGVKAYNLDQIVYSLFTIQRYNLALERARRVIEMKKCPPRFSEEIENLSLPNWIGE